MGGSFTSHTTKKDNPGSPVYVIVENPQGDMATVFTDQLSGKKALLTSHLEFLNTFSHIYNANQTNLNIITPTPGRRLCVHLVVIATESNTGEVELDFLTSNHPVGRLYATRFQQHVSQDLHIEGAVDEPLTLNSTTGANELFIAVSYIEEE